MKTSELITLLQKLPTDVEAILYFDNQIWEIQDVGLRIVYPDKHGKLHKYPVRDGESNSESKIVVTIRNNE